METYIRDFIDQIYRRANNYTKTPKNTQPCDVTTHQCRNAHKSWFRFSYFLAFSWFGSVRFNFVRFSLVFWSFATCWPLDKCTYRRTHKVHDKCGYIANTQRPIITRIAHAGDTLQWNNDNAKTIHAQNTHLPQIPKGFFLDHFLNWENSTFLHSMRSSKLDIICRFWRVNADWIPL